MRSADLNQAPTPELVERFIDLAKERGRAVLDSETRRASRMFDRMRDIDVVLRARGREHRLTLAPLLDSKDRFVRYYAAKYLLGLIPERARATIEAIARYKIDALCGDAAMRA